MHVRPLSAVRRRRALLAVDIAAAAALFVYTLPVAGVLLGGGHAVPGALAALLLCVPFPLRRRRPGVVFAVLCVGAWLHLAAGQLLLPADALLAPALFTVVDRRGTRYAVVATVAALAWVTVAAWGTAARGDLNPGRAASLTLVVAWMVTWGRLARARRGALAALRERTRTDERARIARELHDIVSHGLGVVVVMSEAALTTLRTDPDTAEDAVRRVRDTGRTALADMRRMLGLLRADETGRAPLPTADQLDHLVDTARAAGLPARLQTEGDLATLDTGRALVIHRLVQEALTNVGKHAGVVTTVVVQVARSPEAVTVSVTDDGDGRGTGASRHPGSGHGLVGMAERVCAYGGLLETGAVTGRGFRVFARLPLADPAPQEGS